MRVFVTGASGFIGEAVVRELLGAGHQVTGLARSDAAAAKVKALGAEAQRGSVEDLASLRAGAERADGVIHLAFIHEFDRYAEAGAIDQRAVAALAEALAGTDRPLVVTSGTAVLEAGQLGTEESVPNEQSPGAVRIGSEKIALAAAEKGARGMVVRLPPSVHGEGEHGFLPMLIQTAREKGFSGYVGEGNARWPAVHRYDAARLFRLALEKGKAGAVYHGVSEEGLLTRTLAETIGRRLGVPTRSLSAPEAAAHFGWLGGFFGLDVPASSALTRERLGWEPTQPGLLSDLESGWYFKA